jgi:homospermidine synthase
MSAQYETNFAGRFVITGFGSVGQGVLPLLLRHIRMRPDQVTIVKAHADDLDVAAEFGVRMLVAELRRENLRQTLEPLLGVGDFLLNLSVDVSSTALIELCRERGALYLDTCIEPWPDALSSQHPPAQRTNYVLREAALQLRKSGPAPTAVLTQGANPGLVSQLVKQALLNIARDTGADGTRPASRGEWARLAQQLGVRVIHVAERDTQVCETRKQPGEFVNTWSIEGFIDEGKQPSELGWGSHERHFPGDGRRHEKGCRAAIYLDRPAASVRVRSWAPLAGPFHGFLITHAESISIADYLTIGDPASPEYRPTVHYAYHPCDDAVLSLHELAARNWEPQQGERLLRDELVAGRDELGVLLMGHARGAYWYGSQLTIDEARRLCPYNNATSLQVSAPVMAGVVWAIKNPSMGIVEPDDLPFDEILRLCKPYLGPVVGAYSDWTPLNGRGKLFDEDLDRDDPWQFKNFRVA